MNDFYKNYLKIVKSKLSQINLKNIGKFKKIRLNGEMSKQIFKILKRNKLIY